LLVVDRSARDQLAELVRHLVTGQIDTAYFAMRAEELAETSQDHGVWAVYGAAAGLRDEDLWPVRYRGSNRLSADTRRRMAIAALYLYSDVDYEWPPSSGPRGGCLDSLLCFACGTLLFAGVMLLAASFVWFWLLLASLRCFVSAFLVWGLSQRLVAKYKAQWEEEQNRIGDYDVWPFLTQMDFEVARQRPRLLCGGAKS
jgi:hypothetical protein